MPSAQSAFETRVFEKGDKVIVEGEDAPGLHLIPSGEVAIIGHDAGEPVVVATLGPGDTAGEVALVLQRKAKRRPRSPPRCSRTKIGRTASSDPASASPDRAHAGGRGVAPLDA